MSIIAKLSSAQSSLDLALSLRRSNFSPFSPFSHVDQEWFRFLSVVLSRFNLEFGRGDLVEKENERTGTGTIKCFGGNSITLDMADGFPLISAKHVSHKQAFGEMLWMMKGMTTTQELKALGGGNIWDAWADPQGNLGPIYGSQWRTWKNLDVGCEWNMVVDQLFNAYTQLIKDPFSRRICVSAWNPSFLPAPHLSQQANINHGNMALPPCHHFLQFNVTKMTDSRAVERWNKLHPSDQVDVSIVRDKPTDQPVVSNLRLDLQFDMRSNDLFLGLPYNLAGYGLLLHLFAKSLGYQPGYLHYTSGDAHIYLNHLDTIEAMAVNAREKMKVKSKPQLSISDFVLPIAGEKALPWEYTPEHLSITGYNALGKFNAPVAV